MRNQGPWKQAGCKPEKNPGAKPENKSRFAEPETFLGFEIDLDFPRFLFNHMRKKVNVALKKEYLTKALAAKDKWTFW